MCVVILYFNLSFQWKDEKMCLILSITVPQCHFQSVFTAKLPAYVDYVSVSEWHQVFSERAH